MPVHVIDTDYTASGVERVAHETVLLFQLRRVHQELHAMLALAKQTPAGESYDTTFAKLHRDIDVLARKFLRLSEKLLASED